MRRYTTVEGLVYDVEHFPPKEKRFYEVVTEFYKRKPLWNDFNNYWMSQIARFLNGKTRKEIVELPIFKICLDLEGRIGIEHGYVKLPEDGSFEFEFSAFAD